MDCRRRHAVAALALLVALAGCSSSARGSVTPISQDRDSATPTAAAAISTTTVTGVPTTSSSIPIVTTVPISSPEPILSSQVLVPDLVGLALADAVEALESLELDDPTVVTRESFKEPGRVIRQQPAPGAVARYAVELVVSSPVANVPDFVGTPASNARTWANDREISHSHTTVLTLDHPEGAIISQTPAAGAAAERELALVVAQNPLTMLLGDLPATASDDYGKAAIQLSGVDHPATPYFDIGTNFVSNETGFVTYDINQEWVRLLVTIGIDEGNDPASMVQIDVFIDDVLVTTEELRVGSPHAMNVDLTGASRVHITAVALSGGSDIDVGLVNAVLVSDQPAAP